MAEAGNKTSSSDMSVCVSDISLTDGKSEGDLVRKKQDDSSGNASQDINDSKEKHRPDIQEYDSIDAWWKSSDSKGTPKLVFNKTPGQYGPSHLFTEDNMSDVFSVTKCSPKPPLKDALHIVKAWELSSNLTKGDGPHRHMFHSFLLIKAINEEEKLTYLTYEKTTQFVIIQKKKQWQILTQYQLREERPTVFIQRSHRVDHRHTIGSMMKFLEKNCILGESSTYNLASCNCQTFSEAVFCYLIDCEHNHSKAVQRSLTNATALGSKLP